MGQQQLLLTILGTIIVGIAVYVGISLFRAYSVGSEKDDMVNDLNTLMADAYAYYNKPRSLGGGGQSYAGYQIPRMLRTTDSGIYTCVATARRIFFTGVSRRDAHNTVIVTMARYGDLLQAWTFTGQFQ